MTASTPGRGATVMALGDLAARFGAALAEKLQVAEEKYGYGDAWQASDWQASLLRQFVEHIDKGDPRDVAAYCAFAWHHGWSLSSALTERRAAAEAEVAKVKDYANRVLACVTALHDLLGELQAAAYAADEVGDNSRIKPLHDLLLKRYSPPVTAIGLYSEGMKLGLPEAMPDPEPCINCQTMIAHDAPNYRYREGELACEACAPTWAQDLRDAEEAVAEGGEEPDTDDVAWRDRVKAKIESGAVRADDKAVS